MNWQQTQSYLYMPNKPDPMQTVRDSTGRDESAKAVARNLSNYITPVQLTRLKVDIAEWRRAVSEAELAYLPHRVRMQRMYIDTILNGHVFGLMEARKDLTLLRPIEFGKMQGETWVPSKDLTQQFEAYTWFNYYIEYVLDAIFFGYSLISLGDIIDGDFQSCNIVRRWNISPDRETVSNIIYNPSGMSWNDPEFAPWHVWVPTANGNGVGNCGYGLLYNIALYEIFLRNTLGFNADFVELYSQPYRVGKTTKTTEAERAELENAIRNMGSNGWAIIDPLDEIQFLESRLGGDGWKGYENFEQRCQKMVSKIILGHADGADSIPGKIGGGQGDQSPAEKAKAAKQHKDGHFVLPYINSALLPRMGKFGFKIPGGYVARFNNDKEKEADRQAQDASNMITAQIAQTMGNAGMEMDPVYFQERTGIPTKKKEMTEPVTGEPDGDEPDQDIRPNETKKKVDKQTKIKNQMIALYGRK